MKTRNNWYSVTAKSEDEAEICIYDQIAKRWWEDSPYVDAKSFIKDVKALGDIKKLVVRINSPGGAIYEANTIYNFLIQHKAKKTVYIDGLAASAASIIAMAGEEINMPENTMMMIHNPMNAVFGNAIDMREMANFLDKIKEGMISVYQKKTSLDAAKISEMMDEETWMTAKEAKELGFADNVTDEVQIAAQFEMPKFKNMPDVVKDFFNAGSKPGELLLVENNGGKEKTMPEENKTPDITLELIENQYPAISTALKAKGAEAERQRIKDVEAKLLPGYENLISELKYDGKTTGPEAAVIILQKEQARRNEALNTYKEEAPEPVQAAPVAMEAPKASETPKETPKTLDEELKAEWEKDTKLQAEMDLDAYVLLRKAELEKRV